MYLRKFLLLMLVMITGLVITSSLFAQTVAKVNGVGIPQARLDFMVKAAIAQGQQDSTELRNSLRENLIAEEIVAQEAIKSGLDKSSDVMTQIELARQAILVRAYQAEYIKNNAVGDDVLRREYEEVKSQMGDKEYKARHILVETEKEAKDIIAALKKGGAFDKLAKEKSIDT
ncbi:MAG TPA: peptidylprolyl isomerase, partial [Nitrosomonas sp.]|nr:peptidylprolyl isomerase [Nitrosomonas sp.]